MFALEKIETIIPDRLYAVKWEGYEENEFNRIFRLWKDPEYLENFFFENSHDLFSGFYRVSTVEEAVMLSIQRAHEFQQYVLDASYKGRETDCHEWNDIFTALTSHPQEKRFKTYAPRVRRFSAFWFRLYSIGIENPDSDCNIYIISGGGIKLTRTMNERPHLDLELTKLNILKRFLIRHGIL